MQELSNSTPVHEGDNQNIREQIEKYLIHWKWIVLSVVIALFFAVIYLRYAVPEYKATASILVKDDRKGGMQSELSAFADMGLLTGAKNNVDNEIEIIKSRTIVEKAIKRLGINITYFSEGRVKSIEMYKNKPIVFDFLSVSDKFYNSFISYTVQYISPDKFELFDGNLVSLGKYNYGTIINLNGSKLVVRKTFNHSDEVEDNFTITVNCNRLQNIINSYRSRLNVSALSKTSSVVELSVNDPIREKAEDFLNTVIEIYNEDAIEDKKYISESTQSFINDRLKIITNELGDVEKNAEGYKKSNKLTDIISEAGMYLQGSVELQKSLIEVETQISVVNYFTDYMKTIKVGDLVPRNIIPEDGTSSNTSTYISRYNDMVLERNRIIIDGTPKNYVVINLDKKIEELKGNINDNLITLKATLNIKKRDLEAQERLVKGKISEIPTQEREFRIIDRQQKIKESLYLYLLQKREEIAISLAVTAPNAKIIDPAISSSTPVSPVRNMVYLIALAIGLIIPIGIVFLIDLLDNKIKNRHDIEGKISIPFLGDIPKSNTQDEIINSNSRSGTAEALRIARTNLEFLLTNAQENLAKTIFVTSTVPKEGKTFIAVNMASTIALSGKKVLLVGLDIRNPKIDNYIPLPSKGLTNFLSKNNKDISDYIVKMEHYENFFVLPSGVIPPNPVELLMNNKIDKLFAELKKEYDYIVVDTAPVSLVTDTLLVAKNADAFIYVMRANYLDKSLLRFAENLYRDKKLPNMSVLLNDTDLKKSYGYGYGYGYGVEEEKLPWYKKIFKKYTPYNLKN